MKIFLFSQIQDFDVVFIWQIKTIPSDPQNVKEKFMSTFDKLRNFNFVVP